jgi:hypothetical protein
MGDFLTVSLSFGLTATEVAAPLEGDLFGRVGIVRGC